MEPLMVKGLLTVMKEASGGDQGGYCFPRPAESVQFILPLKLPPNFPNKHAGSSP